MVKVVLQFSTAFQTFRFFFTFDVIHYDRTLFSRRVIALDLSSHKNLWPQLLFNFMLICQSYSPKSAKHRKCSCYTPAGIWSQNDVVSRRIDVNKTSFLRHVPTGTLFIYQPIFVKFPRNRSHHLLSGIGFFMLKLLTVFNLLI